MNNMGREIMAALKRFQVGSDGDGVTVGGALVVSGATTVNTFNVDVISEKTSAAGVTVDGVLLKDSGVVVADGSASAPAVTNTGDTNTGLYFPAADEVAVAAGGSVAASFNSHQFMGMRNRIINGDMRIDQRNAGASTTGTNSLVFPVDRFASFVDTDGTMTFQQSSTAPAGFNKSVVATTTVVDSSLASNQRAVFLTRIEGFNIADLAWGTASAKTVTLSFWVRSSLTGTFGGALTNTSRSYPFTYSISVADTWEQKSITIPGDTSGTWNSTNGFGIQVGFGLGCGTDFSGTANAWTSGDLNSATGAVSVIGTLNATWYVTGVQLEVGSVATPFERRPFGTELALCQRYFVKTNPDNASRCGGFWGSLFTIGDAGLNGNLPVTMRAAPTLSRGGTNDDFYVNGINTNCTGSTSIFSATTTWYSLEATSLSPTGTAGFPIAYNGQASLSAEL
jgi:hypothetical protein